MENFISPEDGPVLERHGLASFEALWSLQLDSIDTPNVDRGGWSRVYRLELEGRGYYLKRQCNHLTRSLASPLGEPTCSREFRNIQLFRARGVPAIEAAFFAHRRLPGKEGGHCAMLLTRALDGWQALDHWLPHWSAQPEALRGRLLAACGGIARQLHTAGLTHGCFYPKHVFLRAAGEGFEAALIDLEKARPAWLGRRDHCRDLDQFFRRATALSAQEADVVLRAYLNCAPDSAVLAAWRGRLLKRRAHKSPC